MPKASFTYSSPSSASCLANSGSFFVSAAWKRRFSRRRTSPSPSPGELRLGVGPDAVRRELHFFSKELREARGDRFETEFGFSFALRPSEVRHEDDARTLLGEPLDGGQRRADPPIVGDLAVLERNVEVDAHEHTSSAGFEVFQEQLLHIGLLALGNPGL